MCLCMTRVWRDLMAKDVGMRLGIHMRFDSGSKWMEGKECINPSILLNLVLHSVCLQIL